MRTYRWLLMGGGIMFLAAFFSFLFEPYRAIATGGPFPCNSDDCYIDTTVDDFAKGTFYATGLSNKDGGEVQLLPRGFSGTWQTDYMPISRTELAAVIFHDIIYVIGGIGTDGHPHQDIISATTYVTGAIKSPGWNINAGTLPIPLSGMAAVISPTQTGGYLYVLGGASRDISGPFYTSAVSFITMTAGGQLSGAWANGTALPYVNGLRYHQAVVHNGYLYVIGGYDGSDHTEIYHTQINSNGSLNTWDPDTQLLTARSSFGAVTWQDGNGTDYLYALAGKDTDTTSTSQVDFTTFNGSALTNPFATTTTMPHARLGHAAVQGSGQIFVTGGKYLQSDIDPVNDVDAALIDSTNGRLLGDPDIAQTWTTSTPLSRPRWHHASVINSGGEIYVIGGAGSLTDGEQDGTNTVFHGSTRGTSRYYALNGTYLSTPMYLGQQRNLTGVIVNSTITDAVHGMTMTLQYRVATDSAMTGATWKSLPGGLLTNPSTVSTTFTINELSKSYFQYKAFYTTTISTTTPLLNAVAAVYPRPATPTPTATTTGTVPTPTPTTSPGSRPEFWISGLSAPVESGAISRTIPYTVSNSNSAVLSAPRQAPGLASKPNPSVRTIGGRKVPPPPSALLGASPSGVSAPRADPPPTYLFYVSFYHFGTDLALAPTTPISLTNAMVCTDYNHRSYPPDNDTYPPFIYYNIELTRTPNTFYAECLVPANTKNFYAQIDTCSYPGDPDCQTYGYVLEQSETSIPPVFTSNIIGPAAAGTTITKTVSGPGGMFLPFIRRQ